MPNHNILVSVWGQEVGVIEWQPESNMAAFEYFPAFVDTGIDLAPIKMPLAAGVVYRFPELQPTGNLSDTFCGLPGLFADSLPEKYGNRLLSQWLARQGRDFNDMTPTERLCYLGSRGMGALEYQPEDSSPPHATGDLDIAELVDVARRVLANNSTPITDNNLSLSNLISVGTSAGGAKAKAVIGWNETTQHITSGQGELQPGFSHWLIKFDEMDNEEHASSQQIGRIEYAYHQMAVDCGIDMMESRLLEDRGMAHFMTRRFDRTLPEDDQAIAQKRHVQTYCAMAHADRNPPGAYGYEHLFLTAKRLGLGQPDLDQLYRRMIFNIISRNQDDHSKNHAFMMDQSSKIWRLSPAYDLCFSYKPGNPFIESHQMSCNGKRSDFTRDDLLVAAKAADVKKPAQIIEEVEDVISYWLDYANDLDIRTEIAQGIHAHLRIADNKL